MAALSTTGWEAGGRRRSRLEAGKKKMRIHAGIPQGFF